MLTEYNTLWFACLDSDQNGALPSCLMADLGSSIIISPILPALFSSHVSTSGQSLKGSRCSLANFKSAGVGFFVVVAAAVGLFF